MNKTILNTGLWSAIICLAAFIIWIIAFTGIAIQAPLFYWTNLEDYIVHVHAHSQFLPNLAKSFMILFSLGYLVLAMVFYEFTLPERKILARIALVFAIMFALLSSVHYFGQVSFVRFAIAKNEYAGLEHFLQANPVSFLSSVNMLGWTLFLGLSNLFLYVGLSHTTTSRGIRIGILINAVSCIFGGIGYLFQIDLLTFIFMNLGIGLGFMIMSVASIIFFIRLKREK